MDDFDPATADLVQINNDLDLNLGIIESLTGCKDDNAREQRTRLEADARTLRRMMDAVRRYQRRQTPSSTPAATLVSVPSPASNQVVTPWASSTGSRQRHDIETAPRKRNFDSLAASDGEQLRSKSRRTTPVLDDGDLFSNVIDLTGEDELRDARDRSRANQRSFEDAQLQRRRQEEEDRQFALLLSRDDSRLDEIPRHVPHQAASNVPSPAPAPSQQHASMRGPGAFSRIMPLVSSTTELPNRTIDLTRPSAYDGPSTITLSSDSEPSTPSLPGTPPLRTGYPPNPPMPGLAAAFPLPSQDIGVEAPIAGPGPFSSALDMIRRAGGAIGTMLNNTSSYFEDMGFDYPDDYDGALLPDPRKTAEDIKNLLANIGDVDIPGAGREGTPDGLRYPLYPHQKVALAWMKKLEEGTNKGGILADDMGLGKTLSASALILTRKSTTATKTNLIVGPVALIRQWEEELGEKIRRPYRLSVFLLHGPRKVTMEELMRYDIVLTTYGTLASQRKQFEQRISDMGGENFDMRTDKVIKEKCPLFHPTTKFWRVILDEAQCIKNQRTKAAAACAALATVHRWCLTGTPMMNGVKELYSLIKFLRIRPYNDWTRFREDFGPLWDQRGSTTGAMTRFRALIKAIMLRRLKTSVIDGKPILQLPEKSVETVYATLSPDELSYYKQLEEKSKVELSKYLRQGTVGKNYSNILVLLLRMRQACCHPHLNLDVEEATVTNEVQKTTDLAKQLSGDVVRRVKENQEEGVDCPICYDAPQGPLILSPCGHWCCRDCLSAIVDTAVQNSHQNDERRVIIKCPYCKDSIDPTHAIPLAIFKKIHMPQDVAKTEGEQASESHSDSDSDLDSDSDSDSELDRSDTEDDDDADDADSHGNLRGFVVSNMDGEESEEELKPKTRGRGQPKGRGRSGRRKAKGLKVKVKIKASQLKELRLVAYRNVETRKKYFRYLSKHWLSSAKVYRCMSLLRDIQLSREKTIVFSQWTFLLDLLEVAMKKEGLPRPCRYDGSMSAEARNQSAHRFRDASSSEQVMLVSLKAGNAGLNLTAASRVIIMDPFWNPYIEMQAVDRAYRIGQTRPVKVYRILVKETVEDRIVDLQNKKKEIVEAALDEAGSMAIGRLSTAELKYMFGL